MRGGAHLAPLLLAAAVAVDACRPAPAPVPAARYVVGEPYSLGGLWSYPREDFALDETGVAAVLPDRAPGRRTANGEVFDPDALVAAHRTLQLPAVVAVTNLETGREIRVRVNNRGPARPGRVIGLSRRAAALLGVPEGGAAQVRVAVDGEASRALAAALPSAEPSRAAQAVAAPAAAVEAEALAPLAGARVAAGAAVPAARGRSEAVEAGAPPPPPERLPEAVAQRAAAPGRLVVEAGTFFRADLAGRQAQRLSALGARVETQGAGRQAVHRVRMGPFGSLAEADRAVAGVLAAGLPEVRLLVE